MRLKPVSVSSQMRILHFSELFALFIKIVVATSDTLQKVLCRFQYCELSTVKGPVREKFKGTQVVNKMLHENEIILSCLLLVHYA